MRGFNRTWRAFGTPPVWDITDWGLIPVQDTDSWLQGQRDSGGLEEPDPASVGALSSTPKSVRTAHVADLLRSRGGPWKREAESKATGS